MIRLENDNTELHFDSYVRRGSVMILREALPLSDPDNLYNYLKNSPILVEENLTPEDFNIFHPVTNKYKNMSVEELLTVITDLTIENQNLKRELL